MNSLPGVTLADSSERPKPRQPTYILIRGSAMKCRYRAETDARARRWSHVVFIQPPTLLDRKQAKIPHQTIITRISEEHVW